MSLPQTIYTQLKDVREFKVGKLIAQTAIIEPTTSVTKTIGIMTESDSYDVFCKNGKDTLTTNARELLVSKNVDNTKIVSLLHKIQPLNKRDTVEKAATVMSHYRMRSIPVVEDEEIIGSVNAKKIVEILNKQNLRWVPASNILTQDPITAKSTDPLATARNIMLTKRIDHLPIIKGDKISQVLTSMHLLQIFTPRERIGKGMRGLDAQKRLGAEIGNLGSTRIPNLTTNSSLSTVIESMLNTATTCSLITLWDNLHGIITYKDIINILESKIPSEVPLYIVGLPDDLRDSEIIKTKFDKIIRNLRKVYTDVQEAKASVKTIHDPRTNRPHYEVVVRVFTPYQTHSYTETGWDLSKVFDVLGKKVIRTLSKRRKNRWKTSIRKINKREIF